MIDYAKAEKYYLEAKAVWEEALGKEYPDYAKSLNNLGNLSWRWQVPTTHGIIYCLRTT